MDHMDRTGDHLADRLEDTDPRPLAILDRDRRIIAGDA